MLVESICIVLILAIIVFVFMRGGRKDYAIAIAPLMIVPFIHILANLIDDLLNISINVNVKSAADVVGLTASVILMGLISYKLHTKKSRVIYLMISGAFTAAITIIFILSYYSYLF